ncbi:hypothetical protein EON65_42340 [archaeon]|nr:MAG: hypothetical protein EON65_42340 [archaeon]
MEEERRQSAMEQSAKLAEINRLRVQLQANAGIVTDQPITIHSNRPIRHTTAQTNGGVSWLGSLLGFYSPSATVQSHGHSGSTKKGHVPRVLKV